jgi:tetratricopeptide (TPR) repeat protein
MKRKILSELRLIVSAEGKDSYRFHIWGPQGDYSVSFVLSSGWMAQLQRLHWKAENLLPEEDSFLNEIATSLGKTIFAHSERQIWSPILSSDNCDFVVAFEPGAFSAMVLPFELISVESHYLVDFYGVRIVRETGHVRAGSRLIDQEPTELRILHVSLDADWMLDLRNERAKLLGSLPGTPIQFLFSPSLDMLSAEIERYRPTVVHLSSHGSFDLLTDEHNLSSIEKARLPTASILERLAGTRVQVLFLASCQSGLFAVKLQGISNALSTIEVCGFTFPVANDTAQTITVSFYQSLQSGADTGKAISKSRHQNLADIFSRFSLVHYRPDGKEYLRFSPENRAGDDSGISYSFSAPEVVMLRLDLAARSNPMVQLLSPFGFGARTLLREWKLLQERSDIFEIVESTELHLKYFFRGDPISREIRIRRFFEYEASQAGALAIVGLIGDFSDHSKEHTREELEQITKIGSMTARIPHVAGAIARGESVNDAVQEVFLANRLDGRLQGLSDNGKTLARDLIGLGGVSRLPLNSVSGMLNLSDKQLVEAQQELMARHLAIELDGSFTLCPELMYLADSIFPDWKKRNSRQLEIIAGAFAVIHREEPLQEESDFTSAHGLLQWSSNLGRWDLLHELLLICMPLYAAAGRTGEIVHFMKIARDHLTGSDQMIYEGNLSAIRAKSGAFRNALREQQDLERYFEKSEYGYDRTLNILAAKSQQANLMINLGRPDEALELLPTILNGIREWKEAPPSSEANVLGLYGEAYRAKEQYNIAAGYFSKALASLEARGALQEKAKFLYALSTTLYAGDDLNGAFAVFAILERELAERPWPELQSNIFHLKGKLLSEFHDPEAMKYLLLSLELDLAAGNAEDSLVSMISVVHNAQLSHDRRAVKSIFPQVRALAAASQNPKHLLTVVELGEEIAGWADEDA